jgi:gamma-glutamylcyclotransferase (GGCT)/AIG2-like uncharacterized protein YtfP
MDERQMASRCNGSKLIGHAHLLGHAFLINERGVASVTPTPEKVVHGLLWTITKEDEKSLDKYEGVASGHYTKINLPIQLEGTEQAVGALVYVASNHAPGLPRPGYLERIISAAHHHSFPTEYILELETWKTKTTSSAKATTPKNPST